MSEQAGDQMNQKTADNKCGKYGECKTKVHSSHSKFSLSIFRWNP